MLGNLIERLRGRLIDDWTTVWHRLPGVRLAAVVATLVAVIGANQGLTVALIALLPIGWLRVVLFVLVGVLIFGIPTVTVLFKPAEKKPKEPTDA